MRWASRRWRVASRAPAALFLLLAGCADPSLASLRTALAGKDSATAVLQASCPEPIEARRVEEKPVFPPPEAVRLLVPGIEETVGYRHVRLRCGTRVLSEAWNWYMPMRLPVEANRQLDGGNVPFGKALAPWHFTRRRLGEVRGRAPGCPAGTILSHRAVLDLPKHGPVSYVLECYTRASLSAAR